jgi:MFS family permease
MVLEGIGAGIWVPSKSAIYWKLTGKESRENVSGYLFGWKEITSIIGPLVGGFLATYLGILSPFYFKAILSLVVIGIYIYVLRKV